MDEVTKEFLIESYENLDMLDRALVELEKDPTHRPSLDSIFRTIHTLKGTCGFLGFSRLERVSHVAENLLSRLREGKLALNVEITSALLATVDAVRRILAIVENTGAEGSEDYSELIERLTILATVDKPPQGPSAQPAVVVVVAPSATAPAVIAQLAPAPAAPVVAAPKVAEPAPEPLKATVPPLAPTPVAAATAVQATASSATKSAEPASGSDHDHHPAEKTETRARGMSDTTVRVDVGLLDKLMNLVGELVLARNQILQLANTYSDPLFVKMGQRLNLITSELQENVMKTRMQPIENVWNKLPRVVRDISTELGKRVKLEMFGKETELDRTIIEAIKDPLTHIIRNSVDHGVELPDDRLSSGKPDVGSLVLRAYHGGGQVNIEIIDDGAGINVKRVRDKAVMMGVLSQDQANRMTDREICNLVFHPGLSTAAKVTNVSGRGVGMDVVKTNIEKIGGSVDVSSEVGKGTMVKIKIPLTLAIIPALIVASGGERFAIPQVNLVELVRMEIGQGNRGVEMIYGVPVYRLRGNLLPLVYLNKELKLESDEEGKQRQPAQDDAINIVVVEADGRQFGLVVDAINDTEEIVVKPLGKQLKSLTFCAGATIMGDGRVALILDVMGLAQHARVISEEHDRSRRDEVPKRAVSSEEKQSLLLFDVGDQRQMVIPLSMVARLEEVAPSEVEWTGNQEVVQYRGQIMLLIRVANYLAASQSAEPLKSKNGQDTMQVVVYSDHGRSVGLVVGRIRDIVQQTLEVKRQVHQNGVIGSTVIQDRVTDLLDVAGIIQQADPSFYKDQS
ncbi:MAG: chemotaxis protein CheA [Pedosphaera sp.]|nr:chemotaxis protein CheA [Pedosphaera sp.]